MASLAAWTLFATDGYNGIDPWYTTLISATTIGYGDQAPLSSDHKWMSAFILPLLTNAFAGWSNPEEKVPAVDKKEMDCGIKSKLQWLFNIPQPPVKEAIKKIKGKYTSTGSVATKTDGTESPSKESENVDQ